MPILTEELDRLAVRFWSKVDKNGPVHPVHGQCWTWTRATFGSGYGAFRWNHRQRRAHRISWTLRYGYLPDLCVLHKCDNRSCVNPDHLFLGTTQDNTEDRNQKNRQAVGERINLAKLSNSEINDIRFRSLCGEYQIDLAAEYGVHRCTIGRITSRKTWKHLS